MPSIMPSVSLFSDRFFFAYLAIIVWAPLPFAGSTTWALNLQSALILALAATMTLTLIIGNKDWTRRLKKHWLALSIFSLIPVWVTLQTLPLPPAWITALSPEAAALQTAAGLERFTFSLEPGRTQQAALQSWSLWLFFVMTLLLVDSSARIRTLLLTVVLCGVFQALYGSFSALSGVSFGVILPEGAAGNVPTGTFHVRNHLAGYLEMCLAMGIGLLVGSLSTAQGQRPWREVMVQTLDTLLGPKMRLRIFLAIMVIALVLTRSRMGNTAFFISLPLCGVLLMIMQRRLHKGAIALFASMILIDVLIVGQWFGFDEVVERLENTNPQTEIRDDVARNTVALLQDYPRTGTGVGTFYGVFPRYDELHRDQLVRHATNDYLELATDFGLIGYLFLASTTLLALGAAIRAMAIRKTQLMKGLAFGSLMGISSLLIHSVADFNLQIPANSLMFVLLLALAQLALKLERRTAPRKRKTGPIAGP